MRQRDYGLWDRLQLHLVKSRQRPSQTIKPVPNPRYAAFLAELKTIRRPFLQPFGTAKLGVGWLALNLPLDTTVAT
jgi:hypothetical protein